MPLRASQAEGAGLELMMPHLEAPSRLQCPCDERESLDFRVNVDPVRFLHFPSKYPEHENH